MINYYVRTTGERVLDDSFSQITYTELVDKEHKPVKSFIKQLKQISDNDSVLIEDDVILCNNFKERIEDVISRYPNNIINFFNVDSRCKIIIDNYLMWNQCTYYPKGISKKIAEIMEKYDDGKTPYDSLELKAIKELHLMCVQYKPDLVQHIDKDTLIQDKPRNRRSYLFIDYFDELGIDYKKELSYNDIKNLKSLMYDKFRDVKIQVKDNDNMIKYFVRTTGERQFNYDPLEVTPLYDYEHKPIDSFIEQLEIISEYDSVLMEDDLILCKNFQEEIEKVIAQYPDKVINFFTEPDVYVTTYIRSEKFTYNQCTYYPKGVAKQIAEQMRKIRKNFPTNNMWYSKIESAALLSLGMTHVIYRPCLVQHNDTKSILYGLFDKDVRTRTTLWFKDYIDELGVPYEKAYTQENLIKLAGMRRRHLKDVFK